MRLAFKTLIGWTVVIVLSWCIGLSFGYYCAHQNFVNPIIFPFTAIFMGANAAFLCFLVLMIMTIMWAVGFYVESVQLKGAAIAINLILWTIVGAHWPLFC